MSEHRCTVCHATFSDAEALIRHEILRHDGLGMMEDFHRFCVDVAGRCNCNIAQYRRIARSLGFEIPPDEPMPTRGGWPPNEAPRRT